jgi:hypothetical protein
MSRTAYDDQFLIADTMYSTPPTGNITIVSNIATASGSVYLANSLGSTGWANSTSMSTSVLSIMAEGDGDAMIKTKKNTINLDEMARMMDTLKERMLILTPAFEKHEQYPALKEAYEHYKLIEALCREDSTK